MRVRLHAEIREKGGAYGGGAFAQVFLYFLFSFLIFFLFFNKSHIFNHSNNIKAGLFGMYSYRDPHVERTLRAFEDAVVIYELLF